MPLYCTFLKSLQMYYLYVKKDLTTNKRSLKTFRDAAAAVNNQNTIKRKVCCNFIL